MLHKATLNYTLLLLLEEPGWSEVSFASTSCVLHPAIHLQGFCSQTAVVFGFPACKSRVDFPSSVGQRNVSEEFQKLFSGQAVEYVLEEQRGTRCRVALSLFCGVWEFALHILQYKISHVVMTAMCMSGKRFHKPNQQIAATWFMNTTIFRSYVIYNLKN